MKILVLDPQNGDSFAQLFVLDAEDGSGEVLQLGYSPEVVSSAGARELAVVETEPGQDDGNPTRYWLKCYDADSLRLKRQLETPVRPMYAGYPGRSHHVMASPSGRFLYLFESSIVFRYPADENVFRLRVLRYDRVAEKLEPGPLTFDSCMLDCGVLPGTEDELYFHLSCDFPSTIAYGRFGSPELTWQRLADLPPRAHCPQETCGSWLDRNTGSLYCVNGEGAIYRARRHPLEGSEWARLPLRGERSVPLHQVCGGGGRLLVGVSGQMADRATGYATEVWQLSLDDGSVVRVTQLPMPAVNFACSPDGELLVSVSPEARSLFVLDAVTARVLNELRDFGVTPAEVLIVP